MSLIDKQRMSHLARHNDTEASFIKKLEEGVKEQPKVLIVDDGSGNACKIAALMAEHEEAVMLGTGMLDPKGFLLMEVSKERAAMNMRGPGCIIDEVNFQVLHKGAGGKVPSPKIGKFTTNPHPKSAEKELKKQFSARQLRKLEKKMGRAAAQVQANTEATPE